MNDKEMTLYQKWREGLIGNFGSFQTKILEAYQIADCDNMQRLEEAFPQWFLPKEKVTD